MAPLIPILAQVIAAKIASKAVDAITRPKETNMEIALGLLRHVLTAGGGILAAKGYGDSGTWETIAGAVAALVGAAWSIIDKRKRAE